MPDSDIGSVVRYERASEERGALPKAHNPFDEGRQRRPVYARTLTGGRARHALDEGEVLSLPLLTSTNDGGSSGGETRTLNLAVNSRLLCH